jgi:hypothetical protein
MTLASPTSTLGKLLGGALAPLTGGIAALRRARMFHPDGTVYSVDVAAAPDGPDLAALSDRVAGPALARFSSAWWRGDKEWPDVLGLALRLRASAERTPLPSPGDQDLLLATIRRPITTPFAPLSTNVHDFLANDYYAVSPFDVDDLGVARFRVVSPRPGTHASSRRARLAADVAAERALLILQVRARRGGWRPLARLRLLEQVELDQAALRFDPFRDGRGIRPRGFVHSLRRGTYAASQRLRPSASGTV